MNGPLAELLRALGGMETSPLLLQCSEQSSVNALWSYFPSFKGSVYGGVAPAIR